MSQISIGELGHLDAQKLSLLDRQETTDREGNTTVRKNGTIRLNGKTYKVSMNGDGSGIQVSRKWNFFLSLFRSGKTRTADAISARIADIVKGSEYRHLESNADRFSRIIARAGKARNIEIANYGFDTNRKFVVNSGLVTKFQNALSRKGRQLSFNTIDKYNALSGIRPKTLQTAKLHQTLDKIRKGDLKVHNDAEDMGFDPKRVRRWQEFLRRPENMAKINIPEKLYNLIHQDPNVQETKKTGWAAAFRKNPDLAMKQFVLKNLNHGITSENNLTEDDLGFIGKKIREYVEIFHKNAGNPAEMDARLEAFNKKGWSDGGKRNRDLMRHIFENVLVYSTFRQTSKLGLSFFKEEKIPVMFQYADYNGSSLKNSFQKKVDGENQWKGDNLDIKAGGSAITYSEMRHVQRMQRQEAEQNSDSRIDVSLPNSEDIRGRPGEQILQV